MAVFSSTGTGNTVQVTRERPTQGGGTLTTTSIDTPDADSGEPGRGTERVETGAVVDPKMPILVGPDAAPTIPDFPAPDGPTNDEARGGPVGTPTTSPVTPGEDFIPRRAPSDLPDPQPAPEETQSNRAQGSRESTEPPAGNQIPTTGQQFRTIRTTGNFQAAGGTSGGTPTLAIVAAAFFAAITLMK